MTGRIDTYRLYNLIPSYTGGIKFAFDFNSSHFWVATSVCSELSNNQSFKISSKSPSTEAAERVDYYALLEVPRDASQENITKAWRSLVLLHHPDKQAGTKGPQSLKDGEVNVDIRLVNEAKWVLGDQQRRKEWEEAFFEGKGEVVVPPSRGPHIYHEISLELFTPHVSANPSKNEEETSQEEIDAEWYSYPCRCSDEFVITHQDLEDGVEVVGCGGCGEWVRVGYETIEEDGEEVQVGG